MIRYNWPSDDEQLAGQWQDSHFDEDAGFWVSVQKAGATLALAAGLLIASSTTLAAQGVFSQSQDDPAGSLQSQPLVYEEYWQNPVAPFNWPQPGVLTDNVETVPFVRVFTPDDGDWRNLVQPVPATNYLKLPFLEPEDFPQFPAATPALEGQDLWVPQFPPPDPLWQLLLFLDDGSTVPAFQPDEDFWTSGVAPVVWPQPTQQFKFGADDLFPQPTQLDEFYWQNRVTPVEATNRLLQQFPFDEQVPAGSLYVIIDEYYWQNPVQPVADSLRLQQQWPFEQTDATGSLLAFRDEDFWVNPVAPVVWPQPSVFTYDDVIPAPPNTGEDEDFWDRFTTPNVAPVPPRMQLVFPYQPDAETMYPTLVAPPPIVPCFMPLPPGGPDSDINISVFGGPTNPTKALFCRLCNSGLPLIIRGDYAIWCQDCCAFVSKQDTYMGTVRAPGQFKAIF